MFSFCNNRLAPPLTRNGKSSKYRKGVQIWGRKNTLVATPIQCNPPLANTHVQEGHRQDADKNNRSLGARAICQSSSKGLLRTTLSRLLGILIRELVSLV